MLDVRAEVRFHVICLQGLSWSNARPRTHLYLIKARTAFLVAGGAKHKQISKHTDNCTDDGKRRIEWTCRMTLLCASFTRFLYSLAFVVRRRVWRCVFVLLAYSDYSNQNRIPADPDKEVKKTTNIFSFPCMMISLASCLLNVLS